MADRKGTEGVGPGAAFLFGLERRRKVGDFAAIALISVDSLRHSIDR